MGAAYAYTNCGRASSASSVAPYCSAGLRSNVWIDESSHLLTSRGAGVNCGSG